MPVPNHREDCQTRIWRTSCPYCHKQVYYFSCTCGSRVFFDEKGYPWPEHHCVFYDIHLLFQQGMTADDVWGWVRKQSYRTGIPIPVDVKKFLDERRNLRTEVVNEVLPGDEPFEIQGEIREIRKVNFFKRFDYTDNPVTRAVLGKLVKEVYVEVVIREIMGSDKSFLNQVTFFVLDKDLSEIKLRTGMKAYAYLNSVVIDDVAVWVAEVIDKAE